MFLEVLNVNKSFNKQHIIKDLSFNLEKGKIYGFIGPNGAGKSTTINLIVGLIKCDTGKILIDGHLASTKEAKAKLGFSPEFPNFYSDMSCIEYLTYMGELSGLNKDEAIKRSLELINEFDLNNHIDKKVHKFSTGMKKKVGLIGAMINNPELLLLDEPTANLDPSARMDIINIVKKLVDENNITVLISSHVLSELESIIDHVIMINNGQKVLDDSLINIQNTLNQNRLVIKTNDNNAFMDFLDVREIKYETKENEVIVLNANDDIKHMIVKFVYENNYLLEKMVDDVMSLEKLYKTKVGGNDESNI